MQYSKEIIELNEQIIQLTEKVNSLQTLYEQVNSQSQHWQNVFLVGVGIAVTVVGLIASLGVFQLIKSMVNDRIEEEIKARGDKANIRKPEFISSIGIISEEGKNDEVKIIKLPGEQVLNFQSNQKDLTITLNNTPLQVKEVFPFLFTPYVGWMIVSNNCKRYNDFLIDISFKIRPEEWEYIGFKNWIKVGVFPKSLVPQGGEIYFDGYSDINPTETNVKFKLTTDGELYLSGFTSKGTLEVNGHCMFGVNIDRR